MSTAEQASSPPLAPQSGDPTTRELSVSVAHLEDLFNAPTVDPFTDADLRALGEPALCRAIRELQASRLRDRRPLRLRIDLRSDQLSANAASSPIQEAVRRYCAAKIADNAATIRLTRRRARRGMEIAGALVFVFAALAYVLLTTLLAHTGTVVQAIVLGSLSVFAWVVLWDTLEAWIFNPRPLTFENRALTQLQQADIVVQATPQRLL